MSKARDVRVISQLIREGEPISAAELREMIIRHIMADPMNPKCAPVTRAFFDTYLNIYQRDNWNPPPVVFGFICANDAMHDAWREAGGGEWQWPTAIPTAYGSFPLDIIVQVAVAMAVSNEQGEN